MTTVSTDRGTVRTNEHRTVSRVTAILEMVVASGANGLRLADLAEMLEAPKSSLHGLAKGLVAEGYLRERKGRYFQGQAIALLALAGSQIPDAFHHALEELTRVTGESSLISTLAGDSAINIGVVESPQVIRASPPIGQRRPLWPSSSGKIFLAFMEERRRNGYLQSKFKNPEERAAILAELEEIRQAGVATNPGGLTPDMHGLACPIQIPGADVTMTIGIAGPSSRMASRMPELAEALKKTAASLSANAF